MHRWRLRVRIFGPAAVGASWDGKWQKEFMKYSQIIKIGVRKNLKIQFLILNFASLCILYLHYITSHDRQMGIGIQN